MEEKNELEEKIKNQQLQITNITNDMENYKQMSEKENQKLNEEKNELEEKIKNLDDTIKDLTNTLKDQKDFNSELAISKGELTTNLSIMESELKDNKQLNDRLKSELENNNIDINTSSVSKFDIVFPNTTNDETKKQGTIELRKMNNREDGVLKIIIINTTSNELDNIPAKNKVEIIVKTNNKNIKSHYFNQTGYTKNKTYYLYEYAKQNEPMHAFKILKNQTLFESIIIAYIGGIAPQDLSKPALSKRSKSPRKTAWNN